MRVFFGNDSVWANIWSGEGWLDPTAADENVRSGLELFRHLDSNLPMA